MEQGLESKIRRLIKRPEFYARMSSGFFGAYWLSQNYNLDFVYQKAPDAFATFIQPLLFWFLAETAANVSRDIKRKYDIHRERYHLQGKDSLDVKGEEKQNVNLQAYYYLSRAEVAANRKDEEAMLKYTELALKEGTNVYPHMLRADTYFNLKKPAEAFVHLRRSMRAFKKIPKMGFLTLWLVNNVGHSFGQNVDPALAATAFYYLKSNEKTVNLIKDLLEDDPDKQLFAAELLEEIIETVPEVNKEWFALREQYWRSAVDHLPKGEVDVLSESRNKVYKFKQKSDYKDAFILKEGDFPAIKSEIETTRILKGVVEDYKGYFVTTPVANIDQENRSLLVIRREPGRNLYEALKAGEDCKEVFDKIVHILAIIHGKFPLEEAGNKENIRQVLEDKLKVMDASGEVKEKLASSYSPVEEVLNDALFVFNKDAHPENWYLSESGDIGILDCEKTRQIPQQCDLVNLMNYGGYLDETERNELIEMYIYRFNEHARIQIKDKNDFRLKYQNARVHRAVSLNVAMQDRATRQEERKAILKGACNAIDTINQEHRDFYAKHSAKYFSLYNAFRTLANTI